MRIALSWLRWLVADCTQRGREFSPGPVHICGWRSTGTGFSAILSILTLKYHPANAQYSCSYYDSSEQVCEACKHHNTLSDIRAASARRGFSSFWSGFCCQGSFLNYKIVMARTEEIPSTSYGIISCELH